MKCLIFNTVNADGIGDFSHFEDIVKALRADPASASIEFTAIVCFHPSGKEANYNMICTKLAAIGIPFFYGKPEDHEFFCQDKTLQQTLHTASQALVISYDIILGTYRRFLRNDIPIKQIGEHDPVIHGDYDLGLSARCYGIKITEKAIINTADAWQVISTSHPEFSNKLLSLTSTSNQTEFYEQNYLVPAYFNIDEHFISFIHFLGVNPHFSKDVMIYHSGSNLENFLTLTPLISYLFSSSAIGKIVYVNLAAEVERLLYENSNHHQTIRIISGAYLNDAAYEALNQTTLIAGVSGDNTFERCVSTKVLPYYYSTNMDIKKATLGALKEIISKPELNLSSEAKNALLIYFDSRRIMDRIRIPYKNHLESEESARKAYEDDFLTLDVPLMLEAWPIVCDYLSANYNFYNHLQQILFCNKPFYPQLPSHKSNLSKHTFFSTPKPIATTETLWSAASKNDISAICQFHANGMDLNQQSPRLGATALWYAAYNGKIEAVKTLCEFNVEINLANKEGATPLFIAAQMGHDKIVELLLNYHASSQSLLRTCDELTMFADTFLQAAGKQKLAQLIQQQENLGSPQQKIEITPEQIAFIMGHERIVSLFIEAAMLKDYRKS